MNVSEQQQTRRLTVSPNIIYSLIQNQAGTLAKAVLECAMNSIDANATKVDIKVTNKSLVISDDGRGFRTKKEILSCFEVFGFEHKEGDRTYGQFGIGRAQLWNFCSTKWRTHTFSMEVDIKNKGLDYNLSENLANIPGLTIYGDFYVPLKPSEIMAFEQEIASLATYAQIPITVNGKLVSKDPSKEKWTHETPEAWISIRESGNLHVYNLGVFVREYPSYQVGCGGKVVTKPGVRLTLNMARNDIILTECKVWKKVKPFLQRQSDLRIKNTKRKLTTSEVDNLAMRFVSGEVEAEDVKNVAFITDVSGKSYSIESFIRKAANLPVITGPKDSQVMDRINQEGMAVVIADETLTRFGVSSPQELGELFMTMSKEQRFTHQPYKIKNIAFVDDSKKIESLLKTDFMVLDNKALTVEEKCIAAALNGYANRTVCYAFNRAGTRVEPRKILIGTSDLADAWTDGEFSIVINRGMLKVARKGLAGMQVLINLMVHEYLHNNDTAGSHAHDLAFYEQFHELTTHPVYGEALASASQTAFKDMMDGFQKSNVKMIKPFKDGIDRLAVNVDFFGDDQKVFPENAALISDVSDPGRGHTDAIAQVRRKPGRPRKVTS